MPLSSADGTLLAAHLAELNMDSRFVHGVTAGIVFTSLANLYGAASGTTLEMLRIAAWSAGGICAYIVLSFVFGFDPYRAQLDPSSPAWRYYIDRWELRLGQATLSLLGCAVLAAAVLDAEHLVVAVVSSTLAAWTYFAWRLCMGGYQDSSSEALR
jgi:hypothetical protein